MKWVEKKGKAKGKGWRIFSDAEFYFSIVSFSKLGGFFFLCQSFTVIRIRAKRIGRKQIDFKIKIFKDILK